MTEAIAGKDMLLKVDADGDGVFTTLAGIQTRTLTLNGALVDITNQESEGNWREAIAGVDVKSMTISGEGVLPKGQTFAVLNDIYFNQAGGGYEWQVYMPGLGVYQGRFVMTTAELKGEQSNVVNFSLTLESSGIVALTPLAA